MTPSPEFSGIIDEFRQAKKGNFFSNLFLDLHPAWREMRYKLVLDSLKKAFPEGFHNFACSGSYEKQYLYFIKTFRTLYQKKRLTPLLHKIIRHLFLKIDYYHFALHLVQNMEKAGHVHKVPSGSFIDRFEETWHAIERAPRRLKLPVWKMTTQFLRGQFNVKFDPFCQENTPYHLFDVDKTSFIRMGTPTREGLLSCFTHKVAINEEFLAFLDDYETSGERHLYVNLQNRLSGVPGYDESPRCKALEELAHRYPKTFFIVTLTKNSAFWRQDESFAHLSQASAFKKELLKQMTLDESGYHFCHEAKITSEFLKKLFDIVHEEFFASEKELLAPARKDFIEIYYTMLIEYLIETLQPASVNITCKDGIDRAGTSSALYYVYDRLKSKGSLSSDDIAHLKAILFAPALLVKKRPPTYERFRRFQSAATRLINHYSLK